jgi:hypothetical protein
MMSFAIGIYGYAFTREFRLSGVRFVPLHTEHSKVVELATNSARFQLTGILVMPVDSLIGLRSKQQFLFDLEAALTFCEQRRVILSNAIQLRRGDKLARIFAQVTSHPIKETISEHLNIDEGIFRRRLRPSSGACLQVDTFSPRSRVRFLSIVLRRLSDAQFEQATGFRSAFFRNVEILKMADPLIEVSHSLLFTGLELLARKRLNPAPRISLNIILYDFISALGFSFTRDEAKQIAACRNAMFHKGELTATYQDTASGKNRVIKVTDLPNIKTLFTDVLLKVLGFREPRINWNRWKDRQAFQRPLA